MSPIRLITIALIIITSICKSIQEEEEEDYKIKLNRNELNTDRSIVEFQALNKALRCSYEIERICTKLKNNENSECSVNRFKFLPFYTISNKVSTKANKISFESVQKFELNLIGKCIQTSEALSDFDKNDTQSVHVNMVNSNDNKFKLTIELIEESAAKSLEVNVISASNDFEVITTTNGDYQLLFLNNASNSYLNANTILAYVIVNMIENYSNYLLRFQINSRNNLELEYDEMKPGLYALKLLKSFNSTNSQQFDYDFFIFVNDEQIIKKFQIKILKMTTTPIIDYHHSFDINETLNEDNNSTGSRVYVRMPGYSLSLYNAVAIIVLTMIILIVIIVCICFGLLFMYFCRKYKRNKNGSEIIKVNSDAKIDHIASISSSTNELSNLDSSQASCVSAKGISTYNLSHANIRYEKPLTKANQKQHNDSTLSISPITTATTITNNIASSNSSSLLVVANVDQPRLSVSIDDSDFEVAQQPQYLKAAYKSKSENYGFYSLKNSNILQKTDEKIFVCNLKTDAQISSV